MGNNFLAFVVVLVYFVGLFVIAAVANKMQQKRAKELNREGTEGYLMASRSMGIPLVMTTIMGVCIGSNATVGSAQGGYVYGFAAGTHAFWLGMGCVVCALLFARRIRKVRMLTISQVYGDCYGESARFVSTIGQIFMNFVIMVSQFIAGGTILSTLLPTYFTMTSGMIISGIIYLLISIFGGWMSCGATNILNMIMCYLGVGLALYAVFSNPDLGGWSGVVANLPDQELYLSPVKGIGWPVWLAYPVMMICNVTGQQSQIQCITSAKNGRTAYWGFLIGGILVAPIGYLCAMVGMAALKLYPDISNTAMVMPMVIMSMPSLLAGLALSGLWAACVSTATNLSISAATLFVNDIVTPVKKSRGTLDAFSPKAQNTLSAVSMIVFTLVSLACSFFVKVLLNFVGAGLALSVPFFVIIILTLFAPQLCRKSTAIGIMVPSYVTMFVWVLFSPKLAPIFRHPIWLMTIVTIIALLVILAVDKRPAFFRTPEYAKKYGSFYWEDEEDTEAAGKGVKKTAN